MKLRRFHGSTSLAMTEKPLDFFVKISGFQSYISLILDILKSSIIDL